MFSFLLYLVVFETIFFISSEADVRAVETCLKCTGYGDGTDCATAATSDGMSDSCHISDWDNTFCQVTRDRGIWRRGCCEGIHNCQDVHEINEDGSTVDTINCHTNDCNTKDPRKTPTTQVETCIICDGKGDGSGCAGEGLQSYSCNTYDWDNTFCQAKRDSGIWKRGCCEGVHNCQDYHHINEDGSTVDTINCHTNDCNTKDPRNTPTTQVEKCIVCSSGWDGSDCAQGGGSDSYSCDQNDWDNTYCQVKRESGSWTRGCCVGVNHCIDVHETNTDGSTNDVVNCHTDDCNVMDPRVRITTTTTTTPNTVPRNLSTNLGSLLIIPVTLLTSLFLMT